MSTPSDRRAQLDDDGQPAPALYLERVHRRLISELLGVCKGIICDGQVTEGEAMALRRWVAGHPDVLIGYPGKVLAERLVRIFADGHVNREEQAELAELLEAITGETPSHDQPLNLSATLPLDSPPPTILFDGYEYVFTGRMLYGTRRQCEQTVMERGARVGGSVTSRTGFLVVGPMASKAWLESTHGRKILRAVELRSEGHPVRIVAEEAWIHALETE
jgi:NAD-dependent DNA ligase